MENPVILVFDDDKHLVELIQEFLEAHNYRVFTAPNGANVVYMAQLRHPSLIILDVDMPVTDGLQALELLRSNEGTQAIPIIMLTGVVSSKVYPKVENLPAVSHIKKPVSLEDLLSMVRHYIPDRD